MERRCTARGCEERSPRSVEVFKRERLSLERQRVQFSSVEKSLGLRDIRTRKWRTMG
jgi:hypothetical protein